MGGVKGETRKDKQPPNIALPLLTLNCASDRSNVGMKMVEKGRSGE